jgi:L-amino acid N-acyltransferase YncA
MPSPEAPSAPPVIRLIGPDDAEATRAIYNLEVASSTVTFDLVERTLAEQIAWIAEHSGSYPAIVAEDASGAVIGFASLSPYRPRPAYATTVEDSVYVHRDQRGAGVGLALLAAIVEIAADHGFHSVIGRIVGGHTASIALHTRVGFREIGREHEVGRKFGKWLDVVLMQKML